MQQWRRRDCQVSSVASFPFHTICSHQEFTQLYCFSLPSLGSRSLFLGSSKPVAPLFIGALAAGAAYLVDCLLTS